jgi:hypothetical protein
MQYWAVGMPLGIVDAVVEQTEEPRGRTWLDFRANGLDLELWIGRRYVIVSFLTRVSRRRSSTTEGQPQGHPCSRS